MFKLEFIINDKRKQIEVKSKGAISNLEKIYLYSSLMQEANVIKKEVTSQAVKQLKFSEEDSEKIFNEILKHI